MHENACVLWVPLVFFSQTPYGSKPWKNFTYLENTIFGARALEKQLLSWNMLFVQILRGRGESSWQLTDPVLAHSPTQPKP